MFDIHSRDTHVYGVAKMRQLSQKSDISRKTNKNGSGSTQVARKGKAQGKANESNLGAGKGLPEASAQGKRDAFTAFCEEASSFAPAIQRIPIISRVESCMQCQAPRRPGKRQCSRCSLLATLRAKGIHHSKIGYGQHWSNPLKWKG